MRISFFGKKPIRLWGFSLAMTQTEAFFVLLVIGLIGAFSYFNFMNAFVRTRDTQRKNDLKRIAGALNDYFYDFSSYPPSSSDNRILACGTAESVRACAWGEDPLRDLKDLSYPPYTPTLPRDPQEGEGRVYVYYSNTQNFYLFTTLENNFDDEYNEKVARLAIPCGKEICEFGIASSGRPEDFSGSF